MIRRQKNRHTYSRFFFMLSLIMRYCTCVQISFAISEPKIFPLTLNYRQSATSLYHQFLKYQSSHLKKKNFFWNVFDFVLLVTLSSFVKSYFTDPSKIILLLDFLKKRDLMDHCHFLMNQRSLNENNIFLEFSLLLNLILRSCTRVKTSFVPSKSKKYFFSFNSLTTSLFQELLLPWKF